MSDLPQFTLNYLKFLCNFYLFFDFKPVPYTADRLDHFLSVRQLFPQCIDPDLYRAGVHSPAVLFQLSGDLPVIHHTPLIADQDLQEHKLTWLEGDFLSSRSVSSPYAVIAARPSSCSNI